jgi:hypothetical protein
LSRIDDRTPTTGPTMESLILFLFVGGWVLLGVLAVRFGHDSRDGIDVPPEGPLWRRPDDKKPRQRRRCRRESNGAPGRVARGELVALAAGR